MWCWWYRRDLTALADDELSLGRAATVRAHLGRCPNCRHEWEGLERAVGQQRVWLTQAIAVADLAIDPMLREVRLRLDDAVSQPPRRWFWQPALITAVAVAGLVVVSALGLFTPLLVAVGIEEPPGQVAQQPELFRDYPLFEHLEALEYLDVLQGPVSAGDADDDE